MKRSKIYISNELYEQLRLCAYRMGRTVEYQLEYWARLGIHVDKKLNDTDVELILAGKAKIVFARKF